MASKSSNPYGCEGVPIIILFIILIAGLCIYLF